ncbi:DEAD/DEAH box helicase [Amnibacterium sp. CER49]|uniref:DEAD/DEAH box helicase n=1 Tax=Amnibacterium sp. CER49 TaxID=3039161 RepID=UPI00244C7E69|nr:DEAD/DEAH box helicase [Amnibacterium sp. CER49]MDH2443743.1 DEAD/DEAH box helicase [Amnibacterium sp. CER49]
MNPRARNNRTESGAKRRWSADDRARRAEPGARTPRRPAADEQTARPARPDRRVDWYPGPRTDPRRRTQDERSGGRDRFGRDDRPRRGYGERASDERRPERPGADRVERADRDRAPHRDDRGQRFDRSDRFERSNRDDRPQRVERDARPQRAERPRQDRFDRPERRTDRPRVERSGDRPRHGFDDRPRTERPFRAEHAEPHERWTPPEDVVLERLEGEVVTADEVGHLTFADLGLGDGIIRALGELGATSPFPIQAATIPDAVAGRNVLGRGRTGSGKTIAFGAALVERLMRNWHESGRAGTGRRMGRAPRALILAPTRELALQIDRTVQPIARALGLFTTQIVGGVPQGRQVGALAKGVDIVIGTPGRIEDLHEQRRLDLSAIEVTVLDEADHMAELGFLEPMQRILSLVPASGQRLLFSATLDAAVDQLVRQFLPEPAVHEVADPEGTGTAEHHVLVLDQGDKLRVLTALLESTGRSLVFARTRAFAEQLADELDDAGIEVESLHGDLNQARRSRNLARFSEGRVKALVATDVAARGIHVDDVELVVHADPAEDYKTYLHRSGRTGRAGAAGTVVTLLPARRRRRFTELLDRAGIEADFVPVHTGDDPIAALAR